MLASLKASLDPEGPLAFLASAARVLAVRRRLRPLVRWQPLADPAEGYTIVLACNAPLARMLHLQLELLRRQDPAGLREVVVVFDRPLAEMDTPVETEARTRFPEIPARFVYHTPEQAAALRGLAWSKCYSWLSWSLGLAAVTTRHAILHDFDAFPLDPAFFANRYARLRETGASFLGVQHGTSAGRWAGDRFAATWELAFDAALVRDRFRPIDLFPRPSLLGAHLRMLDTFHDVQRRTGSVRVEPVQSALSTEPLVHATQLICQATDLLARPGYELPLSATLPLAPYLLYAAGDARPLAAALRAAAANARTLPLLGRELDVSRLTPDRIHGLRQMARSIERALVGRVRPDAEAYFDTLARLAAGNPLKCAA